jgi:LmbE family N-acetylglucosaminyl deacetylase
MRAPLPDPFTNGRGARVLVLAAHQDDETIGAGGLLWRLSSSQAAVAIAHATDGAPHDMADARANGFQTRSEYAAARNAELDRALARLPRPPERFSLGFVDQSLSLHLRHAVRAVEAIVRAWRPSVLLTHPYEGGHPDHDALALIARAVKTTAAHIEFTSYHLWDGAIRAGVFLQPGTSGAWTLHLDDETREVKRAMLDAFVTQRETLSGFDAEGPERFRPAPAYDFRRPPHTPPLLYDLYGWDITSAIWRAQAAALLDEVHAGRAVCR